ncbi:DNA polymerase III subunit delta' [Spiroplasma monobiae]|uniref:DNA polymerase III subunit delta n=1 Tax=Spiroplasma monobiae MQ-1 TaxID=1336748 RepID=A0A2K9LT57_SPISQ|nr:DNA polymerase III subunit delta' [Spiroplasma monobiae]AUM62263.1 DNA polymerase III subunit delta' [Spiroplasma monobiae MQ-1]
MKKIEVFKTVNELIKENKFYHSIIISNENQNELNEISTEITRQIYCSSKSFENDSCDWCLKVIKGNNLNTFFIGDGSTKISKEEIKELIIRFSSTGLEENKNKVYIIANGENLSESASNSILKFLEEPPKNTYAIILTNDRNQILSTIKSRCKLFSIENDSEKLELDSQIINLVINKDKSGLLEYLIDFKKMDKNEIIRILKNTFNISLELNMKYLQEMLLDSINEIKNSNYINLILENLFIKIYEVI